MNKVCRIYTMKCYKAIKMYELEFCEGNLINFKNRFKKKMWKYTSNIIPYEGVK